MSGGERLQLPAIGLVFANVAMEFSLIRRLVATHLQPFEAADACLRLFGKAGPIAAEAVAAAGVGLDLHSGERVLAAVRVPGVVAAFTNHRTIVGGSGIRIAARHDELQDVEAGDGRLELGMSSGRRDLSVLCSHCDALAPFYRALVDLDPGVRVDPPCPTFAPGGGDPTGARGAIGGLWGNDPDAACMLTEVARRAQTGDLDEAAAQDLVGRVVLAHRARSCGPAAFGPNYLSPLTAADFGQLLRTELGPPTGRRSPNPGTGRLDFEVEGTAVWLSYREVSGGTCYTLRSGTERLEAHDAGLAHRLHQRLIDGAYACLERYCTALPVFAHAG